MCFSIKLVTSNINIVQVNNWLLPYNISLFRLTRLVIILKFNNDNSCETCIVMMCLGNYNYMCKKNLVMFLKNTQLHCHILQLYV